MISKMNLILRISLWFMKVKINKMQRFRDQTKGFLIITIIGLKKNTCWRTNNSLLKLIMIFLSQSSGLRLVSERLVRKCLLLLFGLKFIQSLKEVKRVANTIWVFFLRMFILKKKHLISLTLMRKKQFIISSWNMKDGKNSKGLMTSWML